MDKNTVIGLLLIFALFMGFSFYQTSQVKKQRAAQEALNAEETQKQSELPESTLSLDGPSDTTRAAESPATAALTPAQRFSNAQVDEDGDYTVETAKAYYRFSKKGGYLKQVELKDVYRYTPKDSAKLQQHGDKADAPRPDGNLHRRLLFRGRCGRARGR